MTFANNNELEITRTKVDLKCKIIFATKKKNSQIIESNFLKIHKINMIQI